MTRAHNLFLVVASTLGIAYAAVTPPMRVPDEWRHFRRIVQIASGGLIEETEIPESIDWFAHEASTKARRMRRQRTTPYSLATLAEYAARPLERDKTTSAGGEGSNAYTPVPYLPAIATVWLGLHAELRPLALLYLARLSLLAAGVWLVYLAIRVSPALRWSLASLALFPTTSFVRSGVSADTLTIALAYLFFALVLWLRERPGQLRWKEMTVLAGVGAALALSKTGYVPLTLSALALRADRFASRRGYAGALAACVILPWVLCIGWLVTLGGGEISVDSIYDPARASPGEQLALVIHEPLRFARALSATWLGAAALGHLLYSLVGRLGLPDLSLPFFLVPACLGTVLALACVEDRSRSMPSAVDRLLFAGAALACIVAISAIAYVKWSPVGSPVIYGLQGRYLAPILPYVLFALLPPRRLDWREADRVAAIGMAGVALLANGIGLVAIVLSDWGMGSH